MKILTKDDMVKVKGMLIAHRAICDIYPEENAKAMLIATHDGIIDGFVKNIEVMMDEIERLKAELDGLTK